MKLPPDLKKSPAPPLPPTGADDLPIPDLPLPVLGLPLPDLSTVDLPVKNLPDLCNLLLTPPSSILGIDAAQRLVRGRQGRRRPRLTDAARPEDPVPTVEQSAIIPAAPLATITVNQQAEHSDGAFTITGLTINLGGAQVIRLASATCAKPAAKPTPKPTQPTTTPRSPPGTVGPSSPGPHPGENPPPSHRLKWRP